MRHLLGFIGMEHEVFDLGREGAGCQAEDQVDIGDVDVGC